MTLEAEEHTRKSDKEITMNKFNVRTTIPQFNYHVPQTSYRAYGKLFRQLVLLLIVLAMWNTLGSVVFAQLDDPNESPYEYRYFILYDPNSSALKSNPEPTGYLRPADSAVSGFGVWLRHFPMRAPQEPLITYAGSFLAAPNVIGGALDLTTPAPSQGARGVLYRLMIEYARHQEREMETYFPGIADDSALFYRYVTGTYSTNADRSELFWREGDPRAIDDEMIMRYTLFSSSVTSYNSLIRDCSEVAEKDVLPGDVFIQADSAFRPDAHLAIVLDVAIRDTSQTTKLAGLDGTTPKKLYLFANSLTPATNFHIIRPIKPGKTNWFYPGEIQKKHIAYGPGKYYRMPYPFLR